MSSRRFKKLVNYYYYCHMQNTYEKTSYYYYCRRTLGPKVYHLNKILLKKKKNLLAFMGNWHIAQALQSRKKGFPDRLQ